MKRTATEDVGGALCVFVAASLKRSTTPGGRPCPDQRVHDQSRQEPEPKRVLCFQGFCPRPPIAAIPPSDRIERAHCPRRPDHARKTPPVAATRRREKIRKNRVPGLRAQRDGPGFSLPREHPGPRARESLTRHENVLYAAPCLKRLAHSARRPRSSPVALLRALQPARALPCGLAHAARGREADGSASNARRLPEGALVQHPRQVQGGVWARLP